MHPRKKRNADRDAALRLEEVVSLAIPADKFEAALKGARVELLLLRAALFQAARLPSRAAEFLDGVVRSQSID